MIADGNYCADHVRMKKPDDDVELTNGSGYVVEKESYEEHLALAVEFKEVLITHLSMSYH